jgi:hypothetical protein
VTRLRRYTGRSKASAGPPRNRPSWLRPVDGLPDPTPDLPPLDRIEHELGETVGLAARFADEQALFVTGHARPLPHRRPAMPTLDYGDRTPWECLADDLISDPVAWADSLKARWSIAASTDELTQWFATAQAVALTKAALSNPPNRYATPEQVAQLAAEASAQVDRDVIDSGLGEKPDGYCP